MAGVCKDLVRANKHKAGGLWGLLDMFLSEDESDVRRRIREDGRSLRAGGMLGRRRFDRRYVW